MKELPRDEHLPVYSRANWFCFMPHCVAAFAMMIVGFVYVSSIAPGNSSPESGFFGMLLVGLVIGASYFILLVSLPVFLTSMFLSLAVNRWKRKATAFAAGLSFLIAGNIVWGIVVLATFCH